MINNIEVEYRGTLSKEKFDVLRKFFEKEGKFIKEKDRFSVIYFPRGKERLKVSKSPLDLRVRITNKKAEIVLKYGKSSGADARKEFSFPIASEQFEEALEFLFILGFYYGVLQATKTYVYTYQGIEFAIVHAPVFGHYYFEAEILANNESVESANQKIMSVIKDLDLDVLSEKDFYNWLDELSSKPEFRFNFKKEKFSDMRKRFVDYF